MLKFNVTLRTICFLFLFHCVMFIINIYDKRKIPNCVIGKIEPQHMQDIDRKLASFKFKKLNI